MSDVILQAWSDWYDSQDDGEFLQLRKTDISQMSFFAGAKIAFDTSLFIQVIDQEINWHEGKPVHEVNENYRIGFLAGLRHLRNLAAAQQGVHPTRGNVAKKVSSNKKGSAKPARG